MSPTVPGVAVFIYYAFVFGLVLPLELWLQHNTRISLLGLQTIRKFVGRRAIYVKLGLGGSVGVLGYPVLFIYNPALVHAWALFHSPWALWVGVGLLAMGLGLASLAVLQMAQAHHRGRLGRQLITTGAFTVCRNPVLVGLNLCALGTLALLPNVLYALCLGVSLSGQHLRIQLDESYMRLKYGRDYLAYCQITGRYWPHFHPPIRDR